MKNFLTRVLTEKQELVTFVILVVVGGVGYGGYRYYLLTQEFAATTQAYAERVADLEGSLVEARSTNDALTNALIAEQERVNAFAAQFGEIKSTVGTLEKLSKTDPELLQKYSKVYFLNENYVPDLLTDIDPKYLYTPKETTQLHGRVVPYLAKLIDAAVLDGETPKVASAYRSFGTQSSLKSSYRVTYGAGSANQFSADQGYSEHQLGTTVDFTTPKIDGALSGFEKTPEYAWLTAHAHQYGFTLSYPANNKYYIFEPWHWRFVGVALATKLHSDGKYFYDLDQREIDTYLVNIFD